MQYLSLKQSAHKVLRLSQRMLQHARQEEWTMLGQVEQERGRVLEHIFKHPQINESLQTISDILFEVMQVDKTCMQLTEQAQQDIASALSQQKRGKLAVQCYNRHSG